MTLYILLFKCYRKFWYNRLSIDFEYFISYSRLLVVQDKTWARTLEEKDIVHQNSCYLQISLSKLS